MNNNNNEPKSPSLNIDSPKGFIAGMLFGGLAGAGAMLLMAPLSGKHLRTQLQLKGNDIQAQANEDLEEAMDQTRLTANHMTSDIRQKAKKIKRSGKEMLKEQKEHLSAVIDAGKAVLLGH